MVLHIVEDRGESDLCSLMHTFKRQEYGRGGKACRVLSYSGNYDSEESLASRRITDFQNVSVPCLSSAVFGEEIRSPEVECEIPESSLLW